jgi:Cu(I)/Ag(I) efflux system membrane protein CusA/SilA
VKVLHPLAFALLIAAGAAQAQPPKDDASSMKKPAPGMLTDAVVQRIDPASGLIVLKHGDIPNLAMPAMTMGFDVADGKMLAPLKPGDRVRFHVEVLQGKPTVTHIEPAR